jgi:hypothetical protein
LLNKLPDAETVTPHFATLAVSLAEAVVVYFANVPLMALVVSSVSTSKPDASRIILFFFMLAYSPF